MKRRAFISLLGGAAAAWPLAARGQPVAGKVPRIGFLQFGGTTENIAAFMQGLRDAGYIDGRSAIVEARYYDIDRVAGDDRALLPLPGPVRLAVQVKEPTCGRERGAPTSTDCGAAEGAGSHITSSAVASR